MEFKHPKYYAELRAIRRKLQAPSAKPKPEPSSGSSDNQHKRQALSDKLQAPSRKLQAP
jgi:hypothetical protein